MFGKGWIAVYLKHLDIKDGQEQYDIVVEMLDAFYRRVVRLDRAFSKFLAVDTRALLLKQNVHRTYVIGRMKYIPQTTVTGRSLRTFASRHIVEASGHSEKCCRHALIDQSILLCQR